MPKTEHSERIAMLSYEILDVITANPGKVTAADLYNLYREEVGKKNVQRAVARLTRMHLIQRKKAFDDRGGVIWHYYPRQQTQAPTAKV